MHSYEVEYVTSFLSVSDFSVLFRCLATGEVVDSSMTRAVRNLM